MIGDRRTPPFCYQTIAAMRCLRAEFGGEERKTAIAIYQALTEIANEQHRDGGRSGFKAARTRVAEYAGVSTRTLDRYIPRFEEAGLVEVERRQDGDVHLPNIWRLVEPEAAGGGDTMSPGGGDTMSPPATPCPEGSRHGVARGEDTMSPVIRREGEEEKKGSPPAHADGEGEEVVDGVVVELNPEPDPVVEELCQHLAHTLRQIHELPAGHSRFRPTAKARRDMRKLVELRGAEQVRRCIDWLPNCPDGWLRDTGVQSPGSLAKHWTRLKNLHTQQVRGSLGARARAQEDRNRELLGVLGVTT